MYQAVPKRKIKEAKPARRLGRKEILIAPVAMGAATLIALVIVPMFVPPFDPEKFCLKTHNTEAFQLYPHVQIVVDGQQMLLPDGVGKEPDAKGKDCLRPLHTDQPGDVVHIEYIRPIKFTMADFMRIYSPDNSTIKVLDGSSGQNLTRTLNLSDYDRQYSYYSEEGKFTDVAKASEVPPFPADNKMVARLELTSK